MIARRSMENTMRLARSLMLIAGPALLAACTGTVNRGLESVHQPVVTRTDYVFDVALDDGRLAQGEMQRLIGWMASLQIAYGDRVALDDPAGTATGARAELSELTRRYGLFLADQAPITTAPVAPGMVRVVVTRSVAAVPGCPDHSRLGAAEFDSNTTSNFGCAMNSNLASMVARPEDLVRGRPGSLPDPVTSAKAVTTFRKQVNTGVAGPKVESARGN